jgi:hypothetical protein
VGREIVVEGVGGRVGSGVHCSRDQWSASHPTSISKRKVKIVACEARGNLECEACPISAVNVHVEGERVCTDAGHRGTALRRWRRWMGRRHSAGASCVKVETKQPPFPKVRIRETVHPARPPCGGQWQVLE